MDDLLSISQILPNQLSSLNFISKNSAKDTVASITPLLEVHSMKQLASLNCVAASGVDLSSVEGAEEWVKKLEEKKGLKITLC